MLNCTINGTWSLRSDQIGLWDTPAAVYVAFVSSPTQWSMREISSPFWPHVLSCRWRSSRYSPMGSVNPVASSHLCSGGCDEPPLSCRCLVELRSPVSSTLEFAGLFTMKSITLSSISDCRYSIAVSPADVAGRECLTLVSRLFSEPPAGAQYVLITRSLDSLKLKVRYIVTPCPVASVFIPVKYGRAL